MPNYIHDFVQMTAFWSLMVQKWCEASPVVYPRMVCFGWTKSTIYTARDRPLQKKYPNIYYFVPFHARAKGGLFQLIYT